eukprot:TRINITY_DN1881_c0_g2_i1.p1 TRINITY_DN1881_c0_g2~~TRINITY_DN1881_c0_g2_i1.p1  ORF type:complete len:257 (+),score=51.13 TRINITY_DN1881_c0_g2_i1:19-789(+)
METAHLVDDQDHSLDKLKKGMEVLAENPKYVVSFCLAVFLIRGWFKRYNRKIYKATDVIPLDKYKKSKMSNLIGSSPVPIRWIISKSWYYPSLFLNFLYYFTLPEGKNSWWNRIDDTVVLGATPFLGFQVQSLSSIGVTGVINTQNEYSGPVSTYKKYSIEQRILPVVDFQAPSLEQIEEALEFIEKHEQEGGSVYVHCKSGKGRSTVIVICYLIKKLQVNRQEALRVIMRIRPQVTKYTWRFKSVEDFEQKYLNI